MDEGEVLQRIRHHLTEGGRLYVAPSIPEAKEAKQRRAYASLLPEDERILLLYDDTLFGGGGDGFVVTARRLCWKNLGERPRSCLWGALRPESVDHEGAHLRIAGVEVSVTMEAEDLPDLVALLQALASGDPALAEAEAELAEDAPFSERVLLDLASRHLMALDDYYVRGVISPRKLRRSCKVHEGLEPEQVLGLYDDTVFGAGNDGFVITLDALLWRNFLEEPHRVTWSSLDPATVVLREEQVHLGEVPIQLTGKPEEAHKGLARFLREAAGRCRGSWDEPRSEVVQARRCSLCQGLNELEDRVCRSCGGVL